MPLSGRPPPLVDGPPSLTSPAIQRPYQVSRYPHTWRQVRGYPNAGYKHICEALGVAWSAQATKLTQSKIFKDHIVYEDIVIRGLSQHLACPRGRRYPSRSIFASARFTCRPRGGWGFRWYAWHSAPGHRRGPLLASWRDDRPDRLLPPGAVAYSERGLEAASGGESWPHRICTRWSGSSAMPRWTEPVAVTPPPWPAAVAVVRRS